MGGGGSKSKSYSYSYTTIAPVTNVNFEELAEAFMNGAELTSETNKDIAKKETILKAIELQQNQDAMGLKVKELEQDYNKTKELIKNNKAFLLLGVVGLGYYAYERNKKRRKKTWNHIIFLI